MIIDLLSEFCCLPKQTIIEIIKKANNNYRMYYILKKNKRSYRQIFHPALETKMLQYGLIDIYLKKIKIHEAATAYRNGKGSPILKNAIQHVKYPYSIHIDFKDFFPSIKPADLISILINSFSFSDEDINVLEKLLFIRYGGRIFLAIGSPSSPIISNIIMYNIDEQLYKMAETYKGVYTRYADDIWFSAYEKESCIEFLSKIKLILKATIRPSLKINDEKTRFCSRKRSRIITGVCITPDGKAVLPRGKKRYIRSLLKNKIDGTLTEEKEEYLKGYLSFIKDIEPDFYNRLVIKYSEFFRHKESRTS